MSEKMSGYIENESIMQGSMDRKIMQGSMNIGGSVPYDDTELRELIENNLAESKEYTNAELLNFQEKDPTMLAISNLEIENILNKWEE